MLDLIKKIVGTKNEREIKRIRPYVDEINKFEAGVQESDGRPSCAPRPINLKTASSKRPAIARQELEDALEAVATQRGPASEREEIKSRVRRTRQALRQNEAEILEELLPEAFAAVREASRRTIGLRHFDVQLIGGAVLHEGKIAEMKTGEGKTLVATLALYLNALTGRGVHLITVNDYLARRDVQWMGPIYHKLGLTHGVHRA